MGIGFTEGLLIALIVLFLFGGKKIPELGKTLGSSIRNFKEGLNEEDKNKDQDQNKKA